MNTLSHAVTCGFFTSPDGFRRLRARWRQLVGDPSTRKSLTVDHYFVYAMLRGRDWRNGFARPTNAVKLANGLHPHGAAPAVLGRLHGTGHAAELLAPFGDVVCADVLNRLRALVPFDWKPLDREAYPLAVPVA